MWLPKGAHLISGRSGVVLSYLGAIYCACIPVCFLRYVVFWYIWAVFLMLDIPYVVWFAAKTNQVLALPNTFVIISFFVIFFTFVDYIIVTHV